MYTEPALFVIEWGSTVLCSFRHMPEGRYRRIGFRTRLPLRQSAPLFVRISPLPCPEARRASPLRPSPGRKAVCRLPDGCRSRFYRWNWRTGTRPWLPDGRSRPPVWPWAARRAWPRAAAPGSILFRVHWFPASIFSLITAGENRFGIREKTDGNASCFIRIRFSEGGQIKFIRQRPFS